MLSFKGAIGHMALLRVMFWHRTYKTLPHPTRSKSFNVINGFPMPQWNVNKIPKMPCDIHQQKLNSVNNHCIRFKRNRKIPIMHWTFWSFSHIRFVYERCDTSMYTVHTRWLVHWPQTCLNTILDKYFQAKFNYWWLRSVLWNFPQVIVTGPCWW